MFISRLRGDLPTSFSTSFFSDVAGSYPGGVWDSSLYVTARPATRAPVTALVTPWICSEPPVNNATAVGVDRGVCNTSCGACCEDQCPS